MVMFFSLLLVYGVEMKAEHDAIPSRADRWRMRPLVE
jgi:hypothetical protein